MMICSSIVAGSCTGPRISGPVFAGRPGLPARPFLSRASCDPDPLRLSALSGSQRADADPAGPLTLTLASQSYQVITQITVDAVGAYTFTNVAESGEGYNVVFAQENNLGLPVDQVATWAWLGPVRVRAGEQVNLPTFDLGPSECRPLTPVADQAYDPPDPNPDNPVEFTWSPYPGAGGYWLDLARGSDLRHVWQSDLLTGLSATWDGRVNDARAPGEYWWGVGARKPVDPYTLVVYSYWSRFIINP